MLDWQGGTHQNVRQGNGCKKVTDRRQKPIKLKESCLLLMREGACSAIIRGIVKSAVYIQPFFF